MAIIDFESTTVWRAFFLNSLAMTISIGVALIIKRNLGHYVDKNGDIIRDVTSNKKMMLTLVATFFATFAAYTLLKILFNFGGGMLINGENLKN